MLYIKKGFPTTKIFFEQKIKEKLRLTGFYHINI